MVLVSRVRSLVGGVGGAVGHVVGGAVGGTAGAAARLPMPALRLAGHLVSVPADVVGRLLGRDASEAAESAVDERVRTSAHPPTPVAHPPAAAAAEPRVPASADLPLADFDHLTLGSLRARMQRLDVDQLLELHAYEKAHADRLSVVTMLENRIAKLRREARG